LSRNSFSFSLSSILWIFLSSLHSTIVSLFYHHIYIYNNEITVFSSLPHFALLAISQKKRVSSPNLFIIYSYCFDYYFMIIINDDILNMWATENFNLRNNTEILTDHRREKTTKHKEKKWAKKKINVSVMIVSNDAKNRYNKINLQDSLLLSS
jgi:hypothetical protein